MKKQFVFLLLIICLFISSCTQTIKRIEKERHLYGINFTEYTKKGFLFTPYSYNSDYEAIGLIEVRISAGMEFKKPETTMVISGQQKEKWIIIEPIDIDEALKIAYAKAVDMGADAICDLKMESGSETFNDGVKIVPVPTLEIYGFAIKRK